MLCVFFGGGGCDYWCGMFSLLIVFDVCSCFSVYLVFGIIFMCSVYQVIELVIEYMVDCELVYGLCGFFSCLCWYCYFMQKLEDQFDIEWCNVVCLLDGLCFGDGGLWGVEVQVCFDVWCEGCIGYFMIDVCMC